MNAQSLRVEVQEAAGAMVVRVVGAVGDLPAELELRGALSACVSRAAPGALVVVDLSRAFDFTNDACGELVVAYVKAKKRHVRFCLAAVPQEALRKLGPRGLHRDLPLYEIVAAAQDGASDPY